MLSQENIEKLNMNGLYKCEPQLDWIEYYRRDYPYHCMNWTFKPRYVENSNTYYMKDTYFGDEGFELTDENFDKFELLFDFNDVIKYNGLNIQCYDEEDVFYAAIDSSGRSGSRFFIKKDAKINKEKVLKRIEDEIDCIQRSLEWKKDQYERVKSGELILW